MDGEMKGVCEPAVAKELGKVVQFERIGFVKIDTVSASGVLAYFTHT
jgi:glutamyl-tRNA synthetase